MEFEEVIETRRSVHEYTDEDIDDETLEAIFEQARYAPSGYNLQPWEFLVLRDEESKAKLQEVAGGQEHVGSAAASVVVLGSKDPEAHADRVLDDWLDKGYLPNEDVRDAIRENVEGMAEMPESERRVWTTRSTSLVAMSLMYAAWNQGVASCPLEGFDAEALTETFDIDDEYEPVMLVTLGYAPEETDDIENDRKLRRSVDEIVHYESFAP
ncbi:NAD(P)H nitroreductase [Haloprofundus marisrubri]|uniref:NAD(P)H nitroreductase n=1 Tax=Haloprofundus marisrubri TaxID=1514971 RepID=A0A0W1R7S3_9EURY|nr:nitroreductase family protein [Haloprofundus marisrubri]KTG09327.1 NAD(P)H nitroreductase [Haloprofundus marisrubri]